MCNSMRRTSEYEIGQAVLRYLADREGGVATISEIKHYLDVSYPFTEVDRRRSDTRPNEALWHQQVRNLTSHRKSPGNAISDRLLEYERGRLSITSLGRKYVATRYKSASKADVDFEL